MEVQELEGRGQWMKREIFEQPEAVGRLISSEMNRLWSLASEWRSRSLQGVQIAARGTSDHAALYAKYAIETVAGIPVGLAAPSVASVYGAKVDYRGYLVIGVSQSGEAADVLATLDAARKSGAETLAITNVEGSPLTMGASETLLLHAGPEKSVAATKTCTSTLAAMLMLAASLGRREDLLTEINAIPGLIEDALRQLHAVKQVAGYLRYLHDCVVLGRGYNMATAYETALKLRETCYLRAQPFAAPDFVHGPIAMLDDGLPVLAIANEGLALPSVMEVIAAVKGRGADIIVIGNAQEALKYADLHLLTRSVAPEPEIVSPFASVVIGQLLACELSLLRGGDPDHPRGLHKVTITH